jgi:hypothetical protein
MTERTVSLNDLHADPALVVQLSEPARLRLLAAAEGVACILRTALASPSATEPAGPAEVTLSVEQAAARVGLSVEQFYRRKALRPAIIKLGHRTCRVDARKLDRILVITKG